MQQLPEHTELGLSIWFSPEPFPAAFLPNHADVAQLPSHSK